MRSKLVRSLRPLAALVATLASVFAVQTVAATGAQAAATNRSVVVTWGVPVTATEQWTTFEGNVIKVHTAQHRKYPNITLTLTDKQTGRSFVGAGNNGALAVVIPDGVPRACYDTVTLNVSGLGTFVHTPTPISTGISIVNKWDGSGMAGVGRTTVTDGFTTLGRRCI